MFGLEILIKFSPEKRLHVSLPILPPKYEYWSTDF